MHRPHLKLGIDDRFLAFVLLLTLFVGCSFPDKPPVPTPPPVVIVPVTTDQRIALILHESHEQTPEFARLKIDLQSGEAAAYFVSKHHSAFVLDIHSKDENDQPLPVIARLKPTIGNKPLPVLIVAEKGPSGKLGQVLYCESLKPEATGSDIVAAVKQKGG